ncbi:MAG: Flp pilus assembly complex ATPase component TadA [Planctomycetes bacterium]|nr:Flp pilus assembly complex ATPase component TadA [Planctomycetota bacterium]MBI3835731.1 Flp pilus assembly complex ATPase component TadA [Planctomycetota bacterium]
MKDRPSEPGVHDVTDLVDDIIAQALEAGSTDIHWEPIDDGMLVRARVDGQLRDMEVLSQRLSENVISRLKIMASLLTYRIDIPQEGSFLWEHGSTNDSSMGAELRVATFPTVRGERAVVRVFRRSTHLQSLDSLGLTTKPAAQLRAAAALPAGLIVVSGPAGSGKTTTLYALVREIQRLTPGRSIIALEDPVEQRLDRVAQVQINPYGELGYERCMRSVLRHDPQVILLGEVRDRQTAFIVVEAALTGHLILTTMHSGDPAETIVRFLEMGIPPYQLVSAMTLVCSQRLIRLRCRHCGASPLRGCNACLNTGYSGRTAISQISTLDERTRSLILLQSPASVLREELKKQELDLNGRARELLASGVTDEEEVVRILGCKLSD